MNDHLFKLEDTIPEAELPQAGEPQMCIVVRFATSRRVFYDGRPDNPVALFVEDVRFIGNWNRYNAGLEKAVGGAVMRVVDEFQKPPEFVIGRDKLSKEQ